MLARITFAIGYGSRAAEKQKTISFTVKNTVLPGSVDQEGQLTALATKMSERLVANARIQSVNITGIPVNERDVIAKNTFQTVYMDKAGLIPQTAPADAAYKDEVAVLIGSPVGGTSARYKLPYTLIETQAQEDVNLNPQAVPDNTTDLTNWCVAFKTLLDGSFGPVGIPGKTGDFEQGFRPFKSLKFQKYAIYSGKHNRTSDKQKLKDLIKSSFGDMARAVKADNRRIAGTTLKPDPTLISEIKAQYAALQAQYTAKTVATVPTPYVLRSILGVSA